MKRFWILVFGGWMATVGLYGDWFYITLVREREDLYSFEVQLVGEPTSITGKISSSNEHETSVSPWGDVTEVVSAGTIVTFEINGQAFILTGDRYVTLWTKRTKPKGVQNDDKFFVKTQDWTPLRKEKKSSFHFNFDNLKAEVEIMNHEDKTDFTVINPYNEHPWFSNKPIERLEFGEAAPKEEPPKNNDFFDYDRYWFVRNK